MKNSTKLTNQHYKDIMEGWLLYSLERFPNLSTPERSDILNFFLNEFNYPSEELLNITNK